MKKPPLAEKVAYVKRQGQTRDHHCHWPGCQKQVPPALWGCREHWYKLPFKLRKRIWDTFRPGQETNWTPSKEYLEAAREVQEWIKANYPQQEGEPDVAAAAKAAPTSKAKVGKARRKPRHL